jgi:hypothetical protein
VSVLVSDTSLLIDLERSELLDHAFRLGRTFAVPDLLYERELKSYGGPRLLALGLRVEEIEPAAVEKAQQFRRASSSLTVADSLALALAQARAWTLLTGDASLRALAATEGVDCHGILWILDLMENGGIATHAELNSGLSRLARHTRCRLPRAEIDIRLERYRAAAGLLP